MKQYLLFAGSDYYPAGGFEDFVADFDDLASALAARTNKHDWAHVFDIQGGSIVADSRRIDWSLTWTRFNETSMEWEPETDAQSRGES